VKSNLAAASGVLQLRTDMALIDKMLSEGVLDSEEEAAFLRTLPPEAAYLVNEEVAFIGCDHQHEWPEGKTGVEACKGQPHGKLLSLNMGDTFCYACGDAETVKPEQVAEVANIYRKYGGDGLVCWVSKMRNEMPIVEILESPGYLKTWKALYGDLKVESNYCNRTVPRW
jgi:hypothetical protein